MKRKFMSMLLSMAMAAGCVLHVSAAAAKAPSVYAGTSVTVTDKATPATGIRGKDPHTMLFVSAQDKELGSISYRDYNAVIERNRILFDYESGAKQGVPPNNARSWEEWLAAEFNLHRGLARTVNDGSGVFEGYSLLVLSAQIYAVSMRSRANDGDTILFLSAQDIEVGAISRSDYLAIRKRYGTVGAQGKVVPPSGYQTWEQWFLHSFNSYTGAAYGKPAEAESANAANSAGNAAGGKAAVENSGSAGSTARKLKSDEELQRELEEALRLTNEERARQGADPLVMDDELMEYAAIRAQELVQVFGHTRPDGTRALAHREVRAENAYRGGNAQQAVASWIKSPGHHKNMIGAGYTKIGIGVYQGENGVLYWIQVFGYDRVELADFESTWKQGAKYA